MPSKPNIRDIARLSGVSIATVSNILNGAGKASDETRARVLALARDVGYVHVPGKRRSRPKSGAVGIALPALLGRSRWETLLAHNPYFSELIANIEETADHLGYQTCLAPYDPEQELEAWLRERKLGGLLLVGRHPEAVFEALARTDLPVTVLDGSAAQPGPFSSVGIDDRQGAYLATKHLLDLGHRRIAFAEGVPYPKALQQPLHVYHARREGYRKALADLGVPFRQDWLFGGDLSPEGGYQIGRSIFLESNTITAVVATADILAVGLLRAAHERARQVPAAFSIVGFDNIHTSAYIGPGLTTIDQNVREKGACAVRLVVEQMESGQRFARHVEVPIALVRRQSTAPPPA